MWWRCPDSIQCLHRRLILNTSITYYTYPRFSRCQPGYRNLPGYLVGETPQTQCSGVFWKPTTEEELRKEAAAAMVGTVPGSSPDGSSTSSTATASTSASRRLHRVLAGVGAAAMRAGRALGGAGRALDGTSADWKTHDPLTGDWQPYEPSSGDRIHAAPTCCVPEDTPDFASSTVDTSGLHTYVYLSTADMFT